MKKISISLTAVVIGACLAASGPALACGKGGKGGEGGHRGASFEKLDADGDGKVTLAELTSAKEAWLKRADADHDGAVTRSELQTHRRAQHSERAKQRFEKQDQNGDGKLTREESKMPPRLFEKLDENADGVITLAELQAGRGGKVRGPHGKSSGRLGPMDENGDGTITLAEARDAAAAQLERWDGNADGVISKDEMPARERKHRGNHRGGKRGKRGAKGDKA